MKNLKIKFDFFNLLAILAIAVFMTSCGKENINQDLISNNDVVLENANPGVILPQEVIAQGEAAVRAYMENLSQEEVTRLENDFITMEYLKEIGKLTEIKDVKNVELSDFLSDSELTDLTSRLKSSQDNQVENRGCYAIYQHIGGGVYVFTGWIICF